MVFILKEIKESQLFFFRKSEHRHDKKEILCLSAWKYVGACKNLILKARTYYKEQFCNQYNTLFIYLYHNTTFKLMFCPSWFFTHTILVDSLHYAKHPINLLFSRSFSVPFTALPVLGGLCRTGDGVSFQVQGVRIACVCVCVKDVWVL